MYMKDSLMPVLDAVDLLLAEGKVLRAAGLSFRVTHRFRMPGTRCMPGEEVAAVSLVHRGREYHLRLSLALRILFDFLARHSRFPQSARQIELGIRADDFYERHAVNATRRKPLTRKIPRSAVRVYVARLRRALSLAFKEAGLRIDASSVLVSRQTVGNELGYQLKANCDWLHIDLTSQNSQPLWAGNGGHRESVTDSAA